MASGSPDAQWKKIKDIATAQRTCTNSESTILRVPASARLVGCKMEMAERSGGLGI